jgi:isoquinoline 1-oxidoreductase alpha subunit
MTTLSINGKTVTVNAEPDTPLLWVLRGELKLVGTKFGCGKGLCGACTVHLNGEAACALLKRTPRPSDADIDNALRGRRLSAACCHISAMEGAY